MRLLPSLGVLLLVSCLAGIAAAQYTVGPAASPFTPIAAVPGAVFLPIVSNCDDCTEVRALPFSFPWFGGFLNVTSVVVSSNGHVNFDGNPANLCCSAWALDNGEASGTPAYVQQISRACILQEDLHPGLAGDVYALDTGNSMIFSWEGVAFYSNVNTSANGQIELFANGDIEIRLGPTAGGGNDVACGLTEPYFGITQWFSPSSVIPEFNAFGQTSGGMVPQNTGVRFTSSGSGPAEWQTNQLSASLDIDGILGSPSRPVVAVRWYGQVSMVNLNSAHVLMPWDLAITLGPGNPASGGALATPSGQILNINHLDPTLSFFNGLSFAVPFGPFSLPVAIPWNFDVYAQMIVVSPGHPDGFAFSALASLHVRAPRGTTLQGTVPDLGSLGSHVISVLGAPAPNGVSAPESSTGPVGPFTMGQMSLSYSPPSGPTTTVSVSFILDNLSLAITVGGSVVTTLADVFPGLWVFVGTSATLTITADGVISLSITAIVITGVGQVYITDAFPPRIVDSVADGWPGAPNLTQAQSNALVTGFGLGAVLVNKTAGPSDAYDCHGWTFAKGLRWINDDQVQEILDDNGYVQKPAGTAQVGSLAVYTNPANVGPGNPNGITHTGVVTQAPGNVPTQVQSKWGRLGRYRHAPGQVPPTYGAPSYYNSLRGGHRLRTVP